MLTCGNPGCNACKSTTEFTWALPQVVKKTKEKNKKQKDTSRKGIKSSLIERKEKSGRRTGRRDRQQKRVLKLKEPSVFLMVQHGGQKTVILCNPRFSVA